jgi:hypothetical protein
MCIAPPRHRNVERWAGSPRVSHRSAKPDPINEPFRIESVLDAPLRLAPPRPVTVSLNLVGQKICHQIHRALLALPFADSNAT